MGLLDSASVCTSFATSHGLKAWMVLREPASAVMVVIAEDVEMLRRLEIKACERAG